MAGFGIDLTFNDSADETLVNIADETSVRTVYWAEVAGFDETAVDLFDETATEGIIRIAVEGLVDESSVAGGDAGALNLRVVLLQFKSSHTDILLTTAFHTDGVSEVFSDFIEIVFTTARIRTEIICTLPS
ncbi:hypothetical protein CHS0354_001073 [Potamilus streckersoni]|uniref:Uncharacterized protein n=1 Tax=Potamilus streckersoni TaxID=2493646 RepID=A0AAE0VKR9_9BIVA|nr:hypothetical protein CHS0354_001073 [Potamilus streckersoni]